MPLSWPLSEIGQFSPTQFVAYLVAYLVRAHVLHIKGLMAWI